MEYKFNNSIHFLNFVLKWGNLNEYNNYSAEQKIKCNALIKSIYHKNKRFYSELAKDILDNLRIINIEYFESYIDTMNQVKSKNKTKRASLKDIPYLKEIKEILEKCNNCGVYLFHTASDDKIDKVLYVGYSTNLKSRVITSLSEKIDLINEEQFYVSIIDSYNELDSAILELYLINKHNPILNKGFSFNQKDSELISKKDFETSNVILIDKEKWKIDQVFMQ